MVWINWEYFSGRWLERAERKQEYVDDGDRFISLWISFNGWLRHEYPNIVNDSTLVKHFRESSKAQQAFNRIKGEPAISSLLDRLQEICPVENMKYPGDSSQAKRYDGDIVSLMKVIYQIRCNLFHGAKSVEKERRDLELVVLSYNILLPLYKACLSVDYTRQY